MDLRAAVRDRHEAAEQSAWSQLMISGQMTETQYAAMLHNMLPIYQQLEGTGLITKPEVLRSARLQADLAAMGSPVNPGLALSTIYYLQHLQFLGPDDLWAHVYVHYLGNMHGGQIIAQHLPGPHTHLLFDDLRGCMAYVRNHLHTVTAEEANAAFQYTTEIYDELHRLFA